MAYNVTIGGTPIKTPSTFKIARYNLTKCGRVASGDMTMELVAKKRKLFFTYNAISSKDLKTILDLIDTATMFFSVTFYDETETSTSMTCYVGEIQNELHRRPLVSDDSIWKGVEFNFIEQ